MRMNEGEGGVEFWSHCKAFTNFPNSCPVNDFDISSESSVTKGSAKVCLTDFFKNTHTSDTQTHTVCTEPQKPS